MSGRMREPFETELFQTGKRTAGETVLWAFVPLILYAAVTEGLLFLAQALQQFLPQTQADPEAAAALKEMLTLTANLMAGVSMLLLYCKGKKRETSGFCFADFFRRERACSFLPAAVGVCFCAGMSGLLYLVCSSPLLAKVPGEVWTGESGMGTGFEAAVRPIAFLSAGLVLPLTEELLFRQLMYRRLRTGFSPLFCGLFTAAVFGIYHGNVRQGIYAGVMGLILALFTECAGTAAASAMVHISANLAALVLNESLSGFFMESNRAQGWLLTAVSLAACGLLTMAFLKKQGERNGGEKAVCRRKTG